MDEPCLCLEHLLICATLGQLYVTAGSTNLRQPGMGFPVLPADEYQADYISFKPGRPDSSVFKTPEDCKDEPLQSRSRPSSFALQMETLLPSMRLSECGGETPSRNMAAHTLLALLKWLRGMLCAAVSIGPTRLCNG